MNRTVFLNPNELLTVHVADSPFSKAVRRSDAMAARKLAAQLHIFDPNVALIDVGWRIKESEGKRIDRELTVRVHVRQKLRGDAFARFKASHPDRVIDPERIGHAVDVIECSYSLQSFLGGATLPFPPFTPPDSPIIDPPPPTPVTPIAPTGITPMPSRLPNTTFYRPLRGGASGIQEFGTAATFGGFVRDRQTKALMVLSNFHVLAGSATAPRGLISVQPSPLDGGTEENAVCTLVRDAMGDSIDAAVAVLIPGVNCVNDQIGIGSVTGVSEPDLDMVVAKAGRTTGVTHGIVDGVGGTGVLINYGGFSRVIQNVIHIAPYAKLPNKGPVSAGGDSGSWWLDNGSLNAVALHFAGDPVQNYALAIRMPEVLDSLKVDLVL